MYVYVSQPAGGGLEDPEVVGLPGSIIIVISLL